MNMSLTEIDAYIETLKLGEIERLDNLILASEMTLDGLTREVLGREQQVSKQRVELDQLRGRRELLIRYGANAKDPAQFQAVVASLDEYVLLAEDALEQLEQEQKRDRALIVQEEENKAKLQAERKSHPAGNQAVPEPQAGQEPVNEPEDGLSEDAAKLALRINGKKVLFIGGETNRPSSVLLQTFAEEKLGLTVRWYGVSEVNNAYTSLKNGGYHFVVCFIKQMGHATQFYALCRSLNVQRIDVPAFGRRALLDALSRVF